MIKKPELKLKKTSEKTRLKVNLKARALSHFEGKSRASAQSQSFEKFRLELDECELSETLCIYIYLSLLILFTFIDIKFFFQFGLHCSKLFDHLLKSQNQCVHIGILQIGFIKYRTQASIVDFIYVGAIGTEIVAESA